MRRRHPLAEEVQLRYSGTTTFREVGSMRALITGINGFVGGHLADHLLVIGEWEVWGIGRQAELTQPQLQGRVTYLSVDLEQQEATEAAIAQARPDYIFHLAGQASVSQSFEAPGATLMANIFPQLHVFQGIIALGLNPVVLVTCSNEEYGRVRPQDL